jgi:3-oxoacyl-[acyl-carrier-protein] synthase II
MTAAVVMSSGMLTPAGRGLDSLWHALLAGASPVEVRSFELFDRTLELPVAAVGGFVPEEHFAANELRRLDRHHQLGLVAARDAVGGYGGDVSGNRTGVVVGTVNGSIEFMEQQARRLREGYTKLTPMAVQISMRSSLAALVAREFDITGPATTVTTECATGLSAVILGAEWLQLGKIDRVLVGGVDASLTPAIAASFMRMRAVSSETLEPALASRPFAATRNGFVMGEGASFVVLERTESDSASSTGGGTLLGWCERTDLSSFVLPDQAAEQLEDAMTEAVGAAGLRNTDIVSVNAHGTSTPGNDVAEAAAIVRVFGADLPVTAVKGLTGHMLGASGLAELLVAGRSAQTGLVPPVSNTVLVDPEITARIVLGGPEQVAPGPVLTSSLGFGGFAVSAVVGP